MVVWLPSFYLESRIKELKIFGVEFRKVKVKEQFLLLEIEIQL